MPSSLCCHGNQHTVWPGGGLCLRVCTVVCQSGKMCVCVRMFTVHTWAHLLRSVFSFLREGFAVAFRPSLMPRHADVHSSAPQGMFTLQRPSMWTQLVQKERKCEVTSTTRHWLSDTAARRTRLTKVTMTIYSFWQAQHKANRMLSPVAPCFSGKGLCFEYRGYICWHHDPPGWGEKDVWINCVLPAGDKKEMVSDAFQQQHTTQKSLPKECNPFTCAAKQEKESALNWETSSQQVGSEGADQIYISREKVNRKRW